MSVTQPVSVCKHNSETVLKILVTGAAVFSLEVCVIRPKDKHSVTK